MVSCPPVLLSSCSPVLLSSCPACPLAPPALLPRLPHRPACPPALLPRACPPARPPACLPACAGLALSCAALRASQGPGPHGAGTLCANCSGRYRNGATGGAAWPKAPWQCPSSACLGRACLGRARWLWLVQQSQGGEAGPLGAPPPPRVLERAASKQPIPPGLATQVRSSATRRATSCATVAALLPPMPGWEATGATLCREQAPTTVRLDWCRAGFTRARGCLRAALSSGQPRLISRLGPERWPGQPVYRACFRHRRNCKLQTASRCPVVGACLSPLGSDRASANSPTLLGTSVGTNGHAPCSAVSPSLSPLLILAEPIGSHSPRS